MRYFKLFEEFLTTKPIWAVEKQYGLESIASRDTDQALVQRFLEDLSPKMQNQNVIGFALSAVKPVEVTVLEGSPYHPNRCFLSSLEFNKDDERNESIVGILRRKGSFKAWVHAFNKNQNGYFDNSLTADEISDYEHYPLGKILGKDEEDVAIAA